MHKMPKCKMYLVMLMMLFAINIVNAQDIITKTNGEKIKAQVEEITETVIKYRNASNPKGPLYSISLSSVASIQYENGAVDEFNKSSGNSYTNPQQTDSKNEGASDADLLKMAGYSSTNSNQSTMSDSELTKLYNNQIYGFKPKSFSDHMIKAKKYRRIGWIGGAAMPVIGFGIGLIADLSYDELYFCWPGALIGLGAGTIWCGAFNIAANNIVKNARKQQFYSNTIFENQLYGFGNTSLFAGVDLMGNRMTNDHTLGLSLKLNF